MHVTAITADNIYKLFRIERDRAGNFYVVDNRGPNAVLSDHFKSMAEAQREWSRRVEQALN